MFIQLYIIRLCYGIFLLFLLIVENNIGKNKNKKILIILEILIPQGISFQIFYARLFYGFQFHKLANKLP